MVKWVAMLRRIFAQKWTVVSLSLLAVSVMILLATGLHNVELKPGYTLPFDEAQRVQTSLGSAARGFQEVPLWKQVLFWMLIGVLFVLILSLLTPEMRKRLLRSIISAFSTAFLLLYLFREGIINPMGFEAAGEGGKLGQKADGVGDALPIEPFVPPEISPWMTYVIALGFVLAFLATAWFIFRLWKRLSVSTPVLTKPLDELASIARASLDDLAAGEEWDDVIIRCYVRMGEAVRNSRGLSRKHAMTPTEFARRLEQAGLPGEPVRRLTRLFEMVRYGGRPSNQNEINEAVSCLTDILRYCGETP